MTIAHIAGIGLRLAPSILGNRARLSNRAPSHGRGTLPHTAPQTITAV